MSEPRNIQEYVSKKILDYAERQEIEQNKINIMWKFLGQSDAKSIIPYEYCSFCLCYLSRGDYSIIYLHPNSSEQCSEDLKNLQAQFTQDGFFSCNKCFYKKIDPNFQVTRMNYEPMYHFVHMYKIEPKK
jgi:hypothetical protein